MNFPTTYREAVAIARDSNEFEYVSALALGRALGVTAAHGDIIDYRVMLARVRAIARIKANGFPLMGEPAMIVKRELHFGESHRYAVESVWGGPLA